MIEDHIRNNRFSLNLLCELLFNPRYFKKKNGRCSVINSTPDAYHTKKYLQECEQFSIPIKQNFLTGDNVISGDISENQKGSN